MSFIGSNKVQAIPVRENPDLKLARDQILRMLSPASDSDLDRALVAMSMLVGRASDETELDEDAATLQMALYVAELRHYPDDIALFVLSRWHKRSAMWPRWKELQDVLDENFAWRRQLLPALQAMPSYAEAHPEESEAQKEADRNRVLDVYADFCDKMRVQPDPLLLRRATRHRDPDDAPPPPQTDFEKRIAAREAANREAARKHCDAVQERGDTSPATLSADFDEMLDDFEPLGERES